MKIDWVTRAIHQDTEDERMKEGRELLATHGLTGWKLVIEEKKLRRLYAYCWFLPKVIAINYFHLISSDPELVRSTFIHEIAHALVGFDAGHGPIWRHKALEIGLPETLLKQYLTCRGKRNKNSN